MADEAENLKAGQRELPLSRLTPITAFASVIESFDVTDHQELNPRVLEAVAAMRAADVGVTSSNKLGWHSQRDFFERNEPALRDLSDRLKLATIAVIQRYWPEYSPRTDRIAAEGWINVNPQNAFNAPHAHSGFHLSGCYYVRVPEPSADWSGALEFLSPLGATAAESEFGKKMLDMNISIAPQAGRVVLFPSYLRHWVLPNQEDEDRVSIAFNVRVFDRRDD